MKRLLAVGFVAAALLSTLAITPAQASPMGGTSTSCSFVAKLHFKPALQPGFNRLAFIKVYGKVRGCSGAVVTTGHLVGGSEGDLVCRSGVVTGHAAAKARIDWDTGDQSGLNWIFSFSTARLHGKVVSGLFLNERMFSRFSVTAVQGLCADGNPLAVSAWKGNLKL